MTLTDEQKDKIRSAYRKSTDLNEIVRNVFDNTELDGRSKEGRLIRKFMIDTGMKFNTSRKVKQQGIVFTDQQREFIIMQANEGLSSLAIADLLFADKEVKPLSLEQRAVHAVMKEVNPDYSPSQDTDAVLSSYVPPKASGRVLKKINDATGNVFEEDKINRQHKICVEKLAVNLNNSRFVKIMNNYTLKDDRELFEQEFIRLTWDKPDLTSDEINLYMNVCKEIINLEVISKHLNKLNDMFDIANDQEEMSVRLAEIIKAKSSEYHQCETRIENLTKKLQGDRSSRMQSKHKENASILALVQFFQDQEERANMVKIAEMQKQLVSDEASRLEGMDEWKARILGISKDDVI
jgi:vacuolar-type H+-ATPase subunit I/STV1